MTPPTWSDRAAGLLVRAPALAIGIGFAAAAYLAASIPCIDAPRVGRSIGAAVAAVVFLALSRKETAAARSTAGLHVLAFIFRRWGFIAFFFYAWRLAEAFRTTAEDFRRYGLALDDALDQLGVVVFSVGVFLLLTVIFFAIVGSGLAWAANSLARGVRERCPRTLPEPPERRGWTYRWLDLDVAGAFDVDAVVSSLSRKRFTIVAVSREPARLILRTNSWVVASLSIDFERSEGRRFRAVAHASISRLILLLAAGPASLAMLSASVFGFAGTFGFISLSLTTSLRLICLCFLPAVVLQYWGRRTADDARALMERVRNGIADTFPSSPRATIVSGDFWNALRRLGKLISGAPTWLLIVPFSHGIAMYVVRLSLAVLYTMCVGRARQRSEDVRLFELWSQRNASLDTLASLAIVVWLYALFPPLIEAAADPMLIRSVPATATFVAATFGNALAHGFDPAGLPALVARGAHSEFGRTIVRVLDTFAGLALFGMIIVIYSDRLPLLRFGAPPRGGRRIAASERRATGITRAYVVATVCVVALCQSVTFLMALAAVAMAANNALPRIARFNLLYPMALVHAVIPSHTDQYVFLYCLPALVIFAELALCLWREHRIAAALAIDSAPMLVREWNEAHPDYRLRAIMIEDPARAPLLPETRFCCFPPFRYVALPRWFRTPILSRDEAFALLAHEQFHFIDRWRTKIFWRWTFALVLRCPDAGAVLVGAEEENAADKNVLVVLGTHAKPTLQTVLRRADHTPLPPRNDPKESIPWIDLVLPRWHGFSRVWPPASERLNADRAARPARLPSHG